MLKTTRGIMVIVIMFSIVVCSQFAVSAMSAEDIINGIAGAVSTEISNPQDIPTTTGGAANYGEIEVSVKHGGEFDSEIIMVVTSSVLTEQLMIKLDSSNDYCYKNLAFPVGTFKVMYTCADYDIYGVRSFITETDALTKMVVYAVDRDVEVPRKTQEIFETTPASPNSAPIDVDSVLLPAKPDDEPAEEEPSIFENVKKTFFTWNNLVSLLLLVLLAGAYYMHKNRE